MSRKRHWLLAFLIPLGVFLVAFGLGFALDSPTPVTLVLLVAAPLSIIYPCVPLGRLGWRLLRGRPLRPLATGTEVIVWLMSVLIFLTVVYMHMVVRRVLLIQADLHTVASFVTRYRAHCSGLPKTTTDWSAPAGNVTDCGSTDLVTALTNTQTIRGVRAGPFLDKLPSPPPGCAQTGYRFTNNGDGTFKVTFIRGQTDARGCENTTVGGPDRAAQIQADFSLIESAVLAYMRHCVRLPNSTPDLAAARESKPDCSG